MEKGNIYLPNYLPTYIDGDRQTLPFFDTCLISNCKVRPSLKLILFRNLFLTYFCLAKKEK